MHNIIQRNYLTYRHTTFFSLQEERLDVLVDKMKELDLGVEDYWWYLDLRRFGSVPHSGYGCWDLPRR